MVGILPSVPICEATRLRDQERGGRNISDGTDAEGSDRSGTTIRSIPGRMSTEDMAAAVKSGWQNSQEHDSRPASSSGKTGSSAGWHAPPAKPPPCAHGKMAEELQQPGSPNASAVGGQRMDIRRIRMMALTGTGVTSLRVVIDSTGPKFGFQAIRCIGIGKVMPPVSFYSPKGSVWTVPFTPGRSG